MYPRYGAINSLPLGTSQVAMFRLKFINQLSAGLHSAVYYLFWELQLLCPADPSAVTDVQGGILFFPSHCIHVKESDLCSL